MILAIDQDGSKTLLKDGKINTILEKYGYTSAKPMYRVGKNNKSFKVGYVITHKGYNTLWIELFELKPLFKEPD